jgi:hypothetical protein
MAIFEYLRISLARPDAPLLEAMEMSRQEFLREALSKRWDFPYSKRILTYDPTTTDDGQIVGGIVGREIREIDSEGPDEAWKPIELKHWPHALLAVDIGDTEQIAAFQKHGRVGSPRRVLSSLLDHIVKQPAYSMWHPHVEYISSSDDFWAAAKAHAGTISSLNFVFVPPNMLRAKEAIDDLVRAASNEANSEETELKLKNPGGNLVPAGDLVTAAVTTATSGGGEVVMKSGARIIYSSSKNRKTKEIDAEDIPAPSSVDLIRGFFKRLIPK